MKAYIWTNCFCDYHAGLAVVFANTLGEARMLLRKKIGHDHEDVDQMPDIIDVARCKIPSVYYVHGGQ